METLEVRVMQRYFRRTKSQPEGGVGHDGDCDFFNIRVCTCGLLHELMPSPEKAGELYPPFWQERAEFEKVRESLMHPRNGKSRKK